MAQTACRVLQQGELVIWWDSMQQELIAESM